MNYTRIVTTYHEEIEPKGCFNQVMGAAAPAIDTNEKRLRRIQWILVENKLSSNLIFDNG